MSELLSSDSSLLPVLPRDVESEIAAFHVLTDDVLWRIARTTLATDEQEELANLNTEAQSRSLTSNEEARREELLNAYDRMMVRRAQAAYILQLRGYDLSDPTILHL
jgi:hypothetical protein